MVLRIKNFHDDGQVPWRPVRLRPTRNKRLICSWLSDMKSGTQNAENQEILGVRALTPEHHSFIIIHAEESTLVVVPMADLIFITVERRPCAR